MRQDFMGYRCFWGKGAVVVSAEWTPWAFGRVAKETRRFQGLEFV